MSRDIKDQRDWVADEDVIQLFTLNISVGRKVSSHL